jgi:predicted KAP-like P-loop ATPase
VLATRSNPESSHPLQSDDAIKVSESSARSEAEAVPTTSGAIVEESVLAASTGDLPTGDDNLGFEPYVQALAEFLLNPSTHGPLTVSVEGEWGSGKSSFMLQLQHRLANIADAPGPLRQLRTPLTIWFNAWRHDEDEALWAAFASEFTSRIAQ